MRILAIVAAALIATPTLAAEPFVVEAPLVLIVSYADLDLRSTAGQRRLNHRLNGAIEQVCGSYSQAPEVVDQLRIRDCRTAARRSIDQQLAARTNTIQLASR